MGQMSFFTISDKYAALSKMGDPLERLEKVIPWENFRPLLNKVFSKERKSEAGRPPFDYMVMLKVLVLQSLYNLSDEQMEFQLRDRLSFIRFIGVGVEEGTPDQKTIWLFRENLTKAGAVKRLFSKFDRYLDNQGFRAKKGQLIDATLVEVPRQQITEEERAELESDEVPEDWNEPVQRQKDTDARWTQKHKRSYFGYKNHINADNKNKLIRDYAVTPASVHDSQKLPELLSDKNSLDIYADSAYSSELFESGLKYEGFRSHISSKGYRNKELSKFQKELNKRRARIRSRVEHVFGALKWMKAHYIRCIGILRATARIGLSNLTYNLRRYAYLMRTA